MDQKGNSKVTRANANTPAILVSMVALFLLVVACAASLLAYQQMSRRFDDLEHELSQTREAVVSLSEESDRTKQLLDEKVDQASLPSLLPTESDSFLHAVAHRGLSSSAPENTLPAFLQAWHAGFTYVEVDIRFTSDGYPVCLHDETVDRTSNGSGRISDLSLEEVRRFDFGSWKDLSYTWTTIPRFEEFLALCRDLGLHPYIELKDGTHAQISSLVKTVQGYGMEDKVSWISFSPAYLRTVTSNSNAARIGYLVSAVTPEAVSTALSLKSSMNQVFLSSSSYSDEEIRLCREHNVPLELWTIDAAYEMAELDPYISGVTSNTLPFDQIRTGMLFSK